MPEDDTPRNDVAILLEGSHAFESGLMVLSAAESLTDELAAYLLEEITDPRRPSKLINALHVCDFVFERNSEWNFAPAVRKHLLERLSEQPDLFRMAHGRLLQVSRSSGLRREFSELPRYLVEGPGEAYHASALVPSEGLPKYAAIALFGQGGQQWLAARLAREQQAFGIIPPQSLEVDFLQGMVCYREGNLRDAEQLLRRVSEEVSDRIEVAIALHIVGRLDGQRGRTHQAESELNRSLAIHRILGDTFGEAQVLYSLGRLVGRDRSRSGEADEPALSVQVAVALVNKGVTLGRLGRAEDEVAAYDLVVDRFGAAPGPAAGEQVAVALVNKGVTLGQLGRSREAVAAYDLVVDRFGAAPEPELRVQVAMALVNKGVRLDRLGRAEDEVAAYDQVVDPVRRGARARPARAGRHGAGQQGRHARPARPRRR